MWWQFPEATGTTVDIGQMVPYATTGGNIIFYPTTFIAGVTSVSFTGDGVLFTATASAPVTAIGTLTPTLLPQHPHFFLAGPGSGGSDALPTFRAINAADITGLVPPATPGGLNTDVQFNDSGAFGGNAGFTYNKITGLVTVASPSIITPSTHFGDPNSSIDPYWVTNVLTYGVTARNEITEISPSRTADTTDLPAFQVIAQNGPGAAIACWNLVSNVTGSVVDTVGIRASAGLRSVTDPNSFVSAGFFDVDLYDHCNLTGDIPSNAALLGIVVQATVWDGSHADTAVGGHFAVGVSHDAGTSITNLIGVRAGGQTESTLGTVGIPTITNAIAFKALTFANNLATPTITNLYGFYSEANSIATNNYGLYIEDFGTGANNYAIYAAGGKVNFVGNTSLDLKIAATSGANQSSPIFKLGATYWNGAASADASFTITRTVSAGTNPGMVTTFTNAGYGGGGGFNFVGTLNAGNITSSSALFASTDITIQATTPATNILNQSSGYLAITGQYWNGAASAYDSWSLSDVIGAGTNPTATLVFAHAGTPGATLITMPAPLSVTGVINTSVGFQIGGAAPAGHVLRGNGTDYVDATLAASDLSNGVTGTGAVVLATALFPAGATAFSTGASTSSTNVILGLTQNATFLYSFYLPYFVSVLSYITYHEGTLSDNTSNLYDIGIYGPGCLNGAANVPLVCHTGALPGTTICPTNATDMKIPLAGGPVTVNMVPGWYAVAVTSNAVTPGIRISGDAAVVRDLMFTNAAAPGGGTGTTSGGALNSTITAPALAWSRGSYPAVAGF
jgi:hypothetical protein